jgi:predicted dienelactone hydrolase
MVFGTRFKNLTANNQGGYIERRFLLDPHGIKKMNRVSYLILVICSVAIPIAIGTNFYRDNYRWQLLPAIISSLVALLLLLASSKSKLPLPRSVVAATLGVVGFLVTAVCSYLYPVFGLPTPTGRYTVGTTAIDLVDRSRIELCDPTTKSPRELVVQIWYPAISNYGNKATYLPDRRSIPKGVFNHLGLVKTNAVRDVAIAPPTDPYPIVLYSPSWNGYRTDNTFQAEELASHGFVVIGLEHPCSVPMAVYPSGRVIHSNLSSDYTSSDAALATLLRVGEEQLILRTQDIQFVLDRLPQLNQHKLFDSAFDLQKIGIFGHSFGGAAAAQACAIDRRLKAGMNMDGLLFGSAAQHGASQPFFFMQSDYSRPTAAELTSTDGSLRRSKQTDEWGYQQRDRWFRDWGGENLTLLGSAHMNFADRPLKSRIRNGGGSISPDRAMKIINAYTVAFFDRELKGQTSPLFSDITAKTDRLRSGSPFPEVIFEQHLKS